jgi:hypothetical protein
MIRYTWEEIGESVELVALVVDRRYPLIRRHPLFIGHLKGGHVRHVTEQSLRREMINAGAHSMWAWTIWIDPVEPVP